MVGVAVSDPGTGPASGMAARASRSMGRNRQWLSGNHSSHLPHQDLGILIASPRPWAPVIRAASPACRRPAFRGRRLLGPRPGIGAFTTLGRRVLSARPSAGVSVDHDGAPVVIWGFVRWSVTLTERTWPRSHRVRGASLRRGMENQAGLGISLHQRPHHQPRRRTIRLSTGRNNLHRDRLLPPRHALSPQRSSRPHTDRNQSHHQLPETRPADQPYRGPPAERTQRS